MAEFGSINDSGSPKAFYEGQDDNSYGFTPAFKVQTGNTRGTQTVGYGGAKIDGANNRIVITNPSDNTSVGMGVIPGTTTDEFGFFSLDAEGNVVVKIVKGTIYIYDGDDDRMQAGILPDGTINVAISQEGDKVSDAFN